MNEAEDAVSPQEIDRLVDGELSDADRRSLLLRLDRQPDGWRACALAFLEAATWRAAADSLVGSDERPSVAPSAGGEQRATEAHGLRLRWLSLAATVLIAFGFGAVAGNHWTGVSDPIAERTEDEPADVAPLNPQAADVEPLTEEMARELEDEGVEIVGLVRVGDEEATQPAVPIVSGPGLDEKWLRAQPQLLTDHALRQLERRGWRVRQGRQLFSVELRDGQRLTIPLDSVRYEFVGNEVY